MGINSNQKGKRIERQLAGEWRGAGYKARRGQQYMGTPDSPDVVVNLPITLESKGCQKWSIYNWMAKLMSERKRGTLPLLCAKKNHCEFLAITTLDDFLTLSKFVDWEAYGEYKLLSEVKP